MDLPSRAWDGHIARSAVQTKFALQAPLSIGNCRVLCEPAQNWICAEIMVVCAVARSPVSITSLLETGKNTGKIREKAIPQTAIARQAQYFPAFYAFLGFQLTGKEFP
jgi:hypothetical protein